MRASSIRSPWDAINNFAAGGLRPDITFLLDLATDAALQRLRRRSLQTSLPLDRMELELPAFYEQVRAGYLQLAALHPERFVVVDAADSPEDIEATIWQHFTDRYHGFRSPTGA